MKQTLSPHMPNLKLVKEVVQHVSGCQEPLKLSTLPEWPFGKCQSNCSFHIHEQPLFGVYTSLHRLIQAAVLLRQSPY